MTDTYNCMLIATLYGRNEQNQNESPLRRMHHQLYTALNNGSGEGYADRWHDAAGQRFLFYFDAPAAYDTAIIQIGLNAADSQQAAAVAWPDLRAQLRDLFDLCAFNLVWGYSVIYQADVRDSGADVSAPLADLAPLISELEASPPYDLARTDLAGGRLWLFDVPTAGDGLAAKTVYVALAPANSDNRFVTAGLFGPQATLLMPDLLAHKGYHQQRQYALGGSDRNYQQQITDLQMRTNTMLEELTARGTTAASLQAMSQDYARLSKATTNLDKLRHSLSIQQRNYRWWHQPTGDQRNLFEYHYQAIVAAHDNLDLKLDEGRRALAATQAAMQMVQTELDRRHELKQRHFETILTILGVALAVPQLLDRAAAAALLHQVSGGWLPLLNDEVPADLLWLTLLQMLITAAVGYGFWNWLDNRRSQ